ncbi:hypothetical protein ACIZ62_18745 [Acetobacterium carbinolicum]|uniref:hypothetical protein n=1 Tax=Acetobacterium carbinolicum TaxID=52690 RepID=UPI0039BFD28A
MANKILTKKFFRDNPCLKNTVQQFVYSYLLYDGIEDVANEMIIKNGLLSNERLEHIRQENEHIKSEQNPEAIFQLFPKKIDAMNQVELISKALAFDEVIFPMVIEKLLRSNHHIFIENSMRFLAKSQRNSSLLLQEKYFEIRSPYVQSLICLIIGLRGEEGCISWMMDRFFEMKKLYPNETYAEGPLIALHELNCRFS